jgi:hypothetical protein
MVGSRGLRTGGRYPRDLVPSRSAGVRRLLDHVGVDAVRQACGTPVPGGGNNGEITSVVSPLLDSLFGPIAIGQAAGSYNRQTVLHDRPSTTSALVATI